jgi:Bacterial PH domain
MSVLYHRWPWEVRQNYELPTEVQHYLADTETHALGGQVHEAILIEPVGSVLGSALVLGWGFQHIPESLWWLRDALFWLFVVLALRLAWKFWEWSVELIFITAYRIFYVHGLITREVGMMPLSKLTDMKYLRTPLGMVIGYGTFIVESAGQDQALYKLHPIPDPDASYRHVQNLLFKRATQWVSLKDVETEKPIIVMDTSPGRRPGRRSLNPQRAPEDDPRPWWK